MAGMKSFRGRVAVVTGAGSGIGRALARQLDAAGATLALADQDEQGLRETARLLTSTPSSHVVDVSDRERMRALPDEVLRAHGAVHLLVNNAGIASVATVAEQDVADHDRMLAVNFFGVVHGCKFFLEALRDSRPAWIVNNASLMGLVGVAGRSAYCASKFAVRGFSEALAQELAGTDIGVTVIYAGAVQTNIIQAAPFLGDQRTKDAFLAYFERVGVTPDRAADCILRAVRRGKARAHVGSDSKQTGFWKRIAPVKADRWFDRAMLRRVGLTDLRREERERFLNAARGE